MIINIPIKHFKEVLLELHMRDGGKITKFEANYSDNGQGTEICANCSHFLDPNECEIVEGIINPRGWCKYFNGKNISEKWGTKTVVSPSEKGKYHGKSKAELLKSYNALKKSGPHHKGSPEYERMKELAFAIRAKGGWGTVD